MKEDRDLVYIDKNEIVIKKTTNSIINSKMLKAFNRQDDEKLEFKKDNDQYKINDIKLAKINVIYDSIVIGAKGEEILEGLTLTITSTTSG